MQTTLLRSTESLQSKALVFLIASKSKTLVNVCNVAAHIRLGQQ